MTRKKVKLAFIANDSARRATYKKRKKGVLKKVEELSTLCGIEACAIVYSPHDPEPEVWPSHWGVQRVVEKLRTMPQLEQSKKMVNQEGFIGQRILKSNKQMMKLTKDNKEKEMTMFMFQCLNNAGMLQANNNMTTADLNVLSSVIEQNLKDISKRLETLNVNDMTPNQPLMQTPAYQNQMHAPSYQSHLQTPAYQSQMQAPALAVLPKTEEMTLLNYGHGLDMSDNPVQRLLFMDLLNGNGDETIMPQFGDANLQLQTDFWPDLGLLP